ncbi:GntR family transcriptional regulator [Amycolatopsis sp. K13G38]|uniref:GntR family transcriptional regulator n=1 Tax=Amycolatopsis acididurans TaxID=2724524 RepID=A0ABX1J7N6_9PSEU|nr:GntR family transcriptional regulator [Amycolatopsis acididurans]NKQ54307.1 GntR family transcriptional regulator [Amycolatopsis acididurans]
MSSASANSHAAPAGAASERVADYLRGAILSGAIGPGERIRQEEIADRFGISRLPVREALRMLDAEGLTETETNKGSRVPFLDAREVDVVYRMRESLEALALAESVPALDADAVARLAGIQAQIEDNAGADGDIQRFLELDRDFHLGSYTACTVEPLASMVVRLWNTSQHYRRAFVELSGAERMWIVNAEHRLILDAIERRDTDGAVNTLRGHIRRTRIDLATHPDIFRPAR